jgi:hypothetical protein
LPIDRTDREVQLTLAAVDASGRELEFPDADVPAFEGLVSSPLTLGGLWPAEWTVQLRCHGDTVAESRVVIRAAETAECRLVVPAAMLLGTREKQLPHL